MIRIYMCVVLISLAGCATTHKSPLQSNDKFLFVTSKEDEIFQAAYNAMLEGHMEAPIIEISGPVRGYSLTRRWGPDHWRSTIKVFPAEGKTDDGQVVEGYYPEVSGKGTLIIRGPSMDKRIYQAALERFAIVGRRVEVSEIERGEYREKQDASRPNGKEALREDEARKVKESAGSESNSDPSKDSVEVRLEKLNEIHSKGLISDEEYERTKSRILHDM